MVVKGKVDSSISGPPRQSVMRLPLLVHVCVHTFVYLCSSLWFLYSVYTMYAWAWKSSFLGPQNQQFNYIMPSVTLHKTSLSSIYIYIYTFLTLTYFQTWRFNRGNTWIRYGVARFLVFVLDVPRIPSTCIHICSACTAPNCTVQPLGLKGDLTKKCDSVQSLLFSCLLSKSVEIKLHHIALYCLSDT